MARQAPGTFRVCVLIWGALGLGSCQNLHNSLDSLAGETPMQELSGTPVSRPPMVLISHAMKEDDSRVTTLEADNARLKNQLAGALKENAKLKKDLADAIDDKALLKDLAAKKQR